METWGLKFHWSLFSISTPPTKKNVNIIFSILRGGFQLFTTLTKTVDQGTVKHCHGTLRHPNWVCNSQLFPWQIGRHHECPLVNEVRRSHDRVHFFDTNRCNTSRMKDTSIKMPRKEKLKDGCSKPCHVRKGRLRGCISSGTYRKYPQGKGAALFHVVA